MLHTEESFLSFNQWCLLALAVLDEFSVDVFEGFRQDDLADVVEQGGSEREALVVVAAFRDQLGSNSSHDAVFPKLAGIDTVNLLFGAEQLGAANGGNELVNLLESKAGDRFLEIGRTG